MHDPLHLAELLCARLCHDLSGPLGSLMGATELAAEETANSEAAVVAAEAAALLGRKLRFLRAAWSGDGDPMNVEQVEECAQGLGIGKRVQVDLTMLDRSKVFTPAEARIMLNIILLALEALGGSGRLTISGAAGGDVTITIAGTMAKWQAGLATWLADERAAWEALTSSRRMQAPFTALIAHRSGLRLSMLLPVGVVPGAQSPLLLSLSPDH